MDLAPETLPSPDLMDRRAAAGPRLVTTLLLGRIVSASGDTLCRVRNLSSHGARIECALPLMRGEAVELELRCRPSLSARVAWSRDGVAGLHFDAGIATDTLMHAGPLPAGRHLRLPRLAADCPVLVAQGADRLAGTLTDIGQRGCRVVSERPLRDGWLVTVRLPGLGAREANMRWHDDAATGLQFNTALSFIELSAWAARSSARFSPRH